MQPIITKDLLTTAGIEVEPEEEQELLDDLNEALEERVGAEIIESLDDAQVDELASLQESNDDEAIQVWMEENVPHLEDIVKNEVDILLSEVIEDNENDKTS